MCPQQLPWAVWTAYKVVVSIHVEVCMVDDQVLTQLGVSRGLLHWWQAPVAVGCEAGAGLLTPGGHNFPAPGIYTRD